MFEKQEEDCFGWRAGGQGKGGRIVTALANSLESTQHTYRVSCLCQALYQLCPRTRCMPHGDHSRGGGMRHLCPGRQLSAWGCPW